MGWFPEAYAEPASNPVKAEKPAAVAQTKESNQYVALFPYNSEGLFMFLFLQILLNKTIRQNFDWSQFQTL